MECDRCGLCCLHYSGTNWAKQRDLLLWHDLGRKDILSYICVEDPELGLRRGDELSREELARIEGARGWFDPVSGREILPCPFLERGGDGKYRCTIHAIKPDTCRRFQHEDWELFIAYRDIFSGSAD